MKTPKNKASQKSLHRIQQVFFRTQLLLILSLAIVLTAAGILINIHAETQRRDQNLQNVAETIAHSQMLTDPSAFPNDETPSAVLMEYLDSLKKTLSNVDVISVVSKENIRLYHSKHSLIGTVYDGTLPDFEQNRQNFYTASDRGPSGTQRRAYAAFYNSDGSYAGFVMAIMLMENIHDETVRTLGIYIFITMAAVLVEFFISVKQSAKIKKSLLGYEPDAFSAMYKIRDNILESLDEGIIAVDAGANVQFINQAAIKMLETDKSGGQQAPPPAGRPLNTVYQDKLLAQTLENGKKEFNVRESSFPHADVLVDRIPIREGDSIIGAVEILHNRTEYTRLMEDLTGTRYLVDSMRANNHDFTNKLHVILGLIQMERYQDAISYIQNVTIVQRETISKIMRAIDEPAIAALLIGKTARASELNAEFVLREGCRYSKSDMPLPVEALVTIIGNLLDNALEAMNEAGEKMAERRELLFGIFSRPGALLITTDDTGSGIPEENRQSVFEYGFSTKGPGRGTGLYQVKKLVEDLGGLITFESQEGIGTSFTVSFKKTV